MSDLVDIGARCGTDKFTLHSYDGLYLNLLESRRNDKLWILEIGVLYGASMRMWAEYLPQAYLTGLDINSEYIHKHLDTGRLFGCVGDSTEPSAAAKFPDNHYDLIIDDGSHLLQDQLLTLCNFYNKLKPGGAYVVEDVRPENLRFFQGFHPWFHRGTKTEDDCCVVVTR